MDFSKIQTCPIGKRKNLESIKDFIRLDNDIEIENKDLKVLAEKIIKAHKDGKQVIAMFGGHVVKVGCSPLMIDLMKRGVLTHLAVNGAVTIHDFEIALIGETSEDVAANIEDGSFGMSEETGRMMTDAINAGAKSGIGWGRAIGKMIAEKDLKFKEESICYWAYKLDIPMTAHTAIGTEIIYQHPNCDGAAMGKASYDDFKILTESLTKLQDGVIMNIGSAVIMPEVFLKSFTIVRNLGHKVERFTAANLDMLKHYRPKVNVVERPTSKGGLGLQIHERHEKTIPTLHKLILRGLE